MSDQYVYFIQADEDGPIKIGFTADDPKKRLNQLQTGNPATLKLLGAIKGSIAREREFHADLAEWRLQGEWFQPHPTVLTAVQTALDDPQETAEQCLHCSFCFRCQHDDDLILFAGPAANICESCLTAAWEVVTARRSAS